MLAALEHAGILLGAGRVVDAAAVIEPALQRWRDAAWPPTREFLRDGSTATAELLQLRAAVELDRGDAAAALASCDEAQAVLLGIGETRGSTAVAVAARRAEALAARRPAKETATSALAPVKQRKEIDPAALAVVRSLVGTSSTAR